MKAEAKGWRSHHTTTPKPRPISFKKSNSRSKLNPNPNPNPNFISPPKLPPFVNPNFTDRRRWNLHTITVYSISSADATTADTTSAAEADEWPYAAVDNAPQLLHPLTFKPHRYTRPLNLELFQQKTKYLTSFDRTHNFPFDKLVIPPSRNAAVKFGPMVVLHGGGQLVEWVPSYVGPNWVELSGERFDDIVMVENTMYALDREGRLYNIINYAVSRDFRLDEGVITKPVLPGSGRIGWRKRLVVEKRELYFVVRAEEEVFRVYKFIWGSPDYWDDVSGLDGVLFVSKECCFFMDWFGGKEYEDCIVFSESGFPKYGSDGGWEYSGGEDELRVFSLSDGRYGRVGESVGFPEIDWSPPSWVFYVGEPDEDNGVMRSDFKDLNNKDEEEQEGRSVSNIREAECEKA
ncbi:hypothetical protein vseg_007201 [Gypsophila vaccaria]